MNPRHALATAVFEVAEVYAATPGARRPDVSGENWSTLEAEVDAAVGRGTEAVALDAIRRWQEHALAELAEGLGPASNTTLPESSQITYRGPTR